MRATHTYYLLKVFLVPVFIAFFTPFASAQLSKTIYKTVVTNDTLVAMGNRDFMFNTINITNLTNEKISIIVNVYPPEGWDMVTQKLVTISLEANGNTSLPIRLVPTKSKTAAWQTVKVEYRLNDGIEKLTDTFRVRVKEFTKFKASLPLSNYALAGYEKNIKFPVQVKNTGNTPQKFIIVFSNAFLQLDYKKELTLEPTQDSTFLIPIHITDRQWNALRREDIKVQVSVENGETMNLTQVITRIGSVLKDNSSAFLDMPLQVEVGSTFQGEDDIQYYGALHGSVDLTTQDKIALDVRSKTLTKGQSVDNSIIRAEYIGYNWSASAGNVNELTDFYMDGYGAKLGRSWNQRDNIGVYGMFKSRSGDSKLGGINYLYGGMHPNIKVNGNLTANFDNDRKLNSYLLKQGGEWKIGETGKLIVNGGIGMEQSLATLVGGAKNSQWGTSIGYNFQLEKKRYGIVSAMLQNSNSYPGIFKGQRMQNHDARLIFGKTFIGGFYESSLRKANFYQDTTLFSDVFNLKTETYGARTGIGFNGTNIVLSAANQLQVNSDTGTYAQYRFQYLNLNISVLLIKHLFLTVNTYYGQGTIPGQEATTTVTINSNQGSLQYRWIGATLRYDNGPYYYHEYIAFIKNPDEYKRTVISPYLELPLFKKSLNIRSQLNYAKSLPGGIETSNLLSNITYTNVKHGFDFNIIGILPIKQLEATPYVSASLRVRLHTPFVAVRKYYNMRMILFKDANNDGEMNQGEEAITGQMLAIKGSRFITDDNGAILFKNVEKGDYKVDFGFASKIRGWVPNAGPVQTFKLTGNKTYFIPYKASKILNGQLRLEIDDKSNLTFKLSNIKVTAKIVSQTDTITYSTLTQENGEFYFNLPGGLYTIELSPLAFDENFRPTTFTQQADLINNNEKMIYFDIKQRKRTINIKKRD
ncbi:MAG: hypothetical protein JNK00_09110 [Flavipsychrobacter sp.]|nr:hypothetical protein [Flavipsychrobacter sp.]